MRECVDLNLPLPGCLRKEQLPSVSSQCRPIGLQSGSHWSGSHCCSFKVAAYHFNWGGESYFLSSEGQQQLPEKVINYTLKTKLEAAPLVDEKRVPLPLWVNEMFLGESVTYMKTFPHGSEDLHSKPC